MKVCPCINKITGCRNMMVKRKGMIVFIGRIPFVTFFTRGISYNLVTEQPICQIIMMMMENHLMT